MTWLRRPLVLSWERMYAREQRLHGTVTFTEFKTWYWREAGRRWLRSRTGEDV